MKILHIIPSLSNNFGGPAKSVPYLVKSLNELGIENTIFTVESEFKETNEIVKKFDLKVFSAKSLPFFKRFYLAQNFLANVKKQITDETIIHVHSLWTYPSIIGLYAARLYKLPLVVSTRGMLYEWALNQGKFKKKLAMFFYQKKMLDYAFAIHVTEPGELSETKFSNYKNKLRCVPNGIDLSEFKSFDINNLINSFKLNPKKKYITFLSRIHKKKGLIFLVKAWIRLSEIDPTWDLIIAGPIEDKKYAETLKSLIDSNSLSQRVKWLGPLDNEDRIRALNLSNLFVLPSFSENFGIVILEALASGIPVITTKGTPWKIINKKKVGWWIELSEDQLFKSLKQAISLSESEILKKSKVGKEIAKGFSWEIQAKKMKKVYEEAIKYF